jgi:hypothetical protein
MTAANIDLAQTLDVRVRPRMYPPLAVVREFAPDLASLITECERAARDRDAATDAYLALLPGGQRFAKAVADDRAAVVAHIARHQQLPDPAQSPLVELLTQTTAVAYVAAQHARWYADMVAAQLPAWIAKHRKDVVAAMDARMDAIRDELAELLLQARDGKDLQPYLTAGRVVSTWREHNAVRAWLTAPTAPYRNPIGRASWPAELELLEHDAYNATHPDTPRQTVPMRNEHIDEFEKHHPRYANKTMPPNRKRAVV